MKNSFLIFLFLYLLTDCTFRNTRNQDNELVGYIEEMIGSKYLDGNYIILADNECMGCRKLIQQLTSSSHLHDELVLIVRDIKNLEVAKEDFKDIQARVYFDSLKFYNKTKLVLPSAISISIVENKVNYLSLDLPL